MRLTEFLEKRSKAFLLTTGTLFVLLLGVLQLLSGPDVSFLFFYTVPVFLAAWFVGMRAGIFTCVASGVSWAVIGMLTSDHFSNPLVPYWNVLVRTAFMFLLAYLVAAIKKSLEHERELARTDYLTGAFNGRHFAELASAEIQRVRRHPHPFTVAFIDVDDFKHVNDRYGHSTGDGLLQTVADTIKSTLRSVDVAARIGGDEFAVLMPETDGAAAEVVVRRLRRNLLEAVGAKGWPVTFSIGAITWATPPDSVDEMLRAADELMYAAKSGGKNSFRHALSTAPASAA